MALAVTASVATASGINPAESANRFYPPWNMGGQRYFTFVRQNVRFFVLELRATMAVEGRPETEDWFVTAT